MPGCRGRGWCRPVGTCRRASGEDRSRRGLRPPPALGFAFDSSAGSVTPAVSPSRRSRSRRKLPPDFPTEPENPVRNPFPPLTTSLPGILSQSPTVVRCRPYFKTLRSHHPRVGPNLTFLVHASCPHARLGNGAEHFDFPDNNRK